MMLLSIIVACWLLLGVLAALWLVLPDGAATAALDRILDPFGEKF